MSQGEIPSFAKTPTVHAPPPAVGERDAIFSAWKAGETPPTSSRDHHGSPLWNGLCFVAVSGYLLIALLVLVLRGRIEVPASFKRQVKACIRRPIRGLWAIARRKHDPRH